MANVLANPKTLEKLRVALAKDANDWSEPDFKRLLDEYGDQFILEVLRIGVAVALSKRQ